MGSSRVWKSSLVIEMSIDLVQSGTKQRLIWCRPGLTASSDVNLNRNVGALQYSRGAMQGQNLPLGQEVLGTAQHRAGRPVGSRPPCKFSFLATTPCTPRSQFSPAQHSAPQMHSDRHTSSAPPHDHCLSSQIQASSGPALIPRAATASSLGTCNGGLDASGCSPEAV